MRRKLLRVYHRSPSPLKRIFFNLEALRRDSFRRGGDYKHLKQTLNMNVLMSHDQRKILDRLNELLQFANSNTEYFRGAFDRVYVNSFDELSALPTLSKSDVRLNKSRLLANGANHKKIWNGSTSGSTGSPLSYYKDPESVMYNQVLYDKYYEFLGANMCGKKIRLSGVRVLPIEKVTPPFWVYVDKYRQLQCSVYHIGPDTFQHYVDKFKKFKGSWGTGLPSAWTQLARLMNSHGVVLDGLDVIVTDSEELTVENRKEIEGAFMCPVYSTYGLGEVGMFAIQCKNYHYHIVSYTHIAEVVDDHGVRRPDGEAGEIVVTDLFSKAAPFIRYRTGDIGVMSHVECGCGFQTPYFTRIVGRLEDYITTHDGRQFSRVSLIVKNAKNIRESQIIQETTSDVVIRVVPDAGFAPSDMDEVMDDAHKYLGEMNIRWEAVSELERMPSGKVKFLIKRSM